MLADASRDIRLRQFTYDVPMRAYGPVLFIVIGLLALALLQRSPSRFAKPLGPRSRRMGFTFAALALLTFFLPIAELDRPIAGRTVWSTFDIVFKGRGGGIRPWDAFALYACYAAAVCELMAVAVSRSRKLLIAISFVGAWLGLQIYGWGRGDLGSVFRYPRAHLQYGMGMYLLPILMCVALLIFTQEELDVEGRVPRD